jgi:hypothetical protein
VAAGFEPAEGVNPHTLSSSETCCPAVVAVSRDLRRLRLAGVDGHAWLVANETTTETTGWPMPAIGRRGTMAAANTAIGQARRAAGVAKAVPGRTAPASGAPGAYVGGDKGCGPRRSWVWDKEIGHAPLTAVRLNGARPIKAFGRVVEVLEAGHAVDEEQRRVVRNLHLVEG